MYNPDRWVIIGVETPENETIYKVLAGWYGGFGGSDSYQINSGIERVVESTNYYDFIGVSGSVYRCTKVSEGMNNIMRSVYFDIESMISRMHGYSVDIISYECYKNV